MSDNLPEPKNKDDFMEMVADLRPEIMYPELWSDDQAKTLERQGKSSMRTKKAMFANIPMTCRGDQCPVRMICPLYAKNQHPLGEKCPVEANWVSDKMQSIMHELGVDSDNFLELSQVRSLVDLEIQYMRAGGMLADEGFITDEVVGVSPTGKPITKKSLALPVAYQESLLKRMKDIRNQLVATREAKIKAGHVVADQITEISEIMAEIEANDRKKDKLLREKIGIIDVEPPELEE